MRGLLRQSRYARKKLVMALLSVANLWHSYQPNEWSLRDISFQLQQGELLGLLGPSGCGKTTLLRLLAGFERPTAGTLQLDGEQVASARYCRPPERRGVGMVFQDYALFPHLNAWENACFGLRPGQDRSRVHWLLDLLCLQALVSRYPHELSGGQRQRLALARALAPGPRLLLLDEPFSNLDVEVRLRLRSELPGILAKCGVTAVIVTHDPEEALAICDQVAVLAEGCWQQCAPPRQLVDNPATPFVARFVLQANRITMGDLQQLADAGACYGVDSLAADSSCQVLLPQNCLNLQADDKGIAEVISREFLGNQWLYQVQLQQLQLRLKLPLACELPLGSRCRVSLKPGCSPLLFPSAAVAQE
jgi:iron(III) transport system ATP-binding protein